MRVMSAVTLGGIGLVLSIVGSHAAAASDEKPVAAVEMAAAVTNAPRAVQARRLVGGQVETGRSLTDRQRNPRGASSETGHKVAHSARSSGPVFCFPKGAAGVANLSTGFRSPYTILGKTAWLRDRLVGVRLTRPPMFRLSGRLQARRISVSLTAVRLVFVSVALPVLAAEIGPHHDD